MKPKHLNQKFDSHFDRFFESELRMPIVENVKDLADKLEEMNKRLDDSTFVFYSGGAQRNATHMHAQRLIKSETRNPILEVKDQRLAKELGMKAGSYYCYYKPSYVNGFG